MILDKYRFNDIGIFEQRIRNAQNIFSKRRKIDIFYHFRIIRLDYMY